MVQPGQMYWSKKDLESFEENRLAVCAMKSGRARRQIKIPREGRRQDYRTEFQRDRDRILHSRAFRRLKHKTQVFVATESDHQRTRLTHALEVAQMARTLCRALGLNEDLAEAVSLGHDLGHTPFGHIGEEVLHRIMSGRDDLDGILDFAALGKAGGFKHNVQSLRVVDILERRYQNDGLNLTDETRFGILMHTSLPPDVTYQSWKANLFTLESPRFLEAQVVALADEVAQQSHDMEDGLRAGLVTLKEIEGLALVDEVIQKITAHYQGSRRSFHKQNMVIRGTIHFMVTDILLQTARNIKAWLNESGISHTADFYDHLEEIPPDLVGFSPKGQKLFKELKSFVYRKIINSYQVNRMDGRAIHFLRGLFSAYFVNPRQLQNWALFRYAQSRKETYLRDVPLNRVHERIEEMKKEPDFLRLVCDHVAGMTDSFAMEEYENLYLPNGMP
ncbi:MAG: dNTP triphosphohydrolase [bacterium]|nr:dNTP triphosphohydrolase [bacterium]